MDINSVDILLVEDNPNDAELIIRALKKTNVKFNIIHIEDGETALDFFWGIREYKGRNMSSNPKIVILDLNLPKVSGIEILQKVKIDERTKSIPIVMLTSSKQEKDIINSYKYGVNSYLVKPIDFVEFSEVIKNIALYWLILNETPK